jgi:hypothetical protein
VDLIAGDITGRLSDRTRDTHASARVAMRFDAETWNQERDYLTMSHVFRDVRSPMYVRVAARQDASWNRRKIPAARIHGAICGSTRIRCSSSAEGSRRDGLRLTAQPRIARRSTRRRL